MTIAGRWSKKTTAENVRKGLATKTNTYVELRALVLVGVQKKPDFGVPARFSCVKRSFHPKLKLAFEGIKGGSRLNSSEMAPG